MADGLSQVGQADFSAGAVLSVARHLISEQGLYDVHDGLYDDDGSVYRRGGDQYKSNAAFGTSGRWCWDANFAAGQRTIFASSTTFGVLDSDDATPLNLGGAGLLEPVPAALVGGILFIGGGVMYAGSRKTADYSTGTVTTTQGSKIVTGAGTTWLANVDPGMLFRTASNPYYVVASVDSNTQITLAEAYAPSGAAGLAYTLTRLGALASHISSASPTAVGTAPIFLSIAGRLIAIVGNTVYFSDTVTPWGAGAIVAATDGIYAVDGISQPQMLSRSITPRLVSYVRAGYKPGGIAVYKNHLLVPVLDASNFVVDQMVCRLDRQVRTPQGDVFPWSFFSGHGGNVACWAVRAAGGSQRLPDLLGVARGSDARVVKAGSFFEPSATVKNDADATTHNLDVVTRDFETGGGIFNLVRMLKLWYELIDAASDNPTVKVYYSTGPEQAGVPKWGAVTWGLFTWFSSDLAEFVLLANQAPESDGRMPYVWSGDQGMHAHTRFIRFRIRSSGPAARVVLRSLTAYVRLSARSVS
jgi:hypothetical protein